MANAGAIRAGRAFVEAFWDGKKLDAGLKAAQRKLESWGKGISAIGSTIAASGAFDIAKSLLIGGPLGGAVGHFTNTANELHDVSNRTGVAVEQLSALKFAADQSGLSLGDMEAGLLKLRQKGFGEGIPALARFADMLKSIQNPMARTHIATEIWGDSITRMLPALKDGAAGVNRLMAEAKSAGAVMSKESAEAADKLDMAIRKLRFQASALATNIGGALAPALSELAAKGSKVLSFAIDWIKANQGLVVSVAGFAVLTAGIGAAQVALGTMVFALGKLVALGGTGIGLLVKSVGLLASPLGVVLATLAGLTSAWLLFTDAGNKAAEALGQTWNEIKDTAIGAWKGIVDAIRSGDLLLAGKIALAGLKVAWLTAVDNMRAPWVSFTSDLAKNFNGAIALVKTYWTDFVGYLKTRITELIREYQRFLAYYMTGSFDARQAALFQADSDALDRQAGISDEAEKKKRDIRAQYLRDQAALESKEQSRLADDAKSELEEARKQLDDLTRTAAERAQKAAGAGMEGQITGSGPFIPPTGNSIGTFNSRAALALSGGSGGPQEQTAKNTAAIAQILREILSAAQQGGLNFG